MQSIGGLNLCCATSQMESFAMGSIKVFQPIEQTNSNPFVITNETYKVVLDSPAIAIKQLSAKAIVEIFGITSGEFYRIAVAQSEVAIDSSSSATIQPNDVAIVTTDYQLSVKGRIARVNRTFGAIEIYVNALASVPEAVESL